MSVHVRRHAPAPSGRRIAHGHPLVALCGALFLAGCSGTPLAPVTGEHPADPDARTRPAAYQPVIGAYARQRPGDPSGWRENNERVAPQEKP